MSKVVTTTLLPDVAGGTVTLGGTGDSVVATGNDLRTNVLQDAGGNAVLTSNGSGVLSGMNSGFGGALNLLSTQTASNAANVSFTTQLTSTYDVYIFKFFDWNPATDGTDCTFNGSIDGGSNYNVTKTTSIFRAYHGENDSNTGLDYEAAEDIAQDTGYQNLSFYCGGDADECSAGELYLFGPSSTTYLKHFYSTVQMIQGGEGIDSTQNIFVGGYFNTTSAINAIDFKCSAGNMDAVIKLYGISKS